MRKRNLLGTLTICFAGSIAAAACGGDDTTIDGAGGAGTGGDGTGTGGDASGTGGSGTGGDTTATGGDGTGTGGDTTGTGGDTTGTGGDTTGTGGAMGGMGGTATGGSTMGGMGGVPLMCLGTATACDTYTESSICKEQYGCFTNGTCSTGMGGGGGTDCSEQTTENDCETNDCTWEYPCQNAQDCSTATTSGGCNMPGCIWNDTDSDNQFCEEDGTCASITLKDTCSTDSDCTWDDSVFTCGGTATACEDMSDANCNDQDGCNFE